MTRDTIFISHATPEDNDFTIWLASRLTMLGYKVWIDKNALVGGEKFWEEIDQTIRNTAAKVLLVYSENICQKDQDNNIIPGKLKDGIYKEFSLAESISKQNNLADFIILLNKDGVYYNLFIGADRLNQIPFYENWADGFKQLYKKLLKDEVPVFVDLANTEFADWFQSQYIVPNPIVQKREMYYSNVWPIQKLPASFYIHQFKTEEQAAHFSKLKQPFPVSKISNYVSSFEGDLLYNMVDMEGANYVPERILEIKIKDIFIGIVSKQFPTQNDAENHFKYLLKKTFHLLMKNRGMFWYEMSSRKLAYFYTPGNLNSLKVKFEYPYRVLNKWKTKNLIGVYKKTFKWHYAVSVRLVLSPLLGFQLKNHLAFTTDGFQVWKNDKDEVLKDKIHSHRRSKGKMMFNEEWRDLFLAFLNGLRNSDGLIQIQLSNDFTLQMFPDPELFRSDFGYFDPKDKTRHGLLSMYEEEGEDLEELNNEHGNHES